VEAQPPQFQSKLAKPAPPSGNPLWAVPLGALTATRERPIFSPRRRPPAPVLPPAPPMEPPKRPIARPAPPETPPFTLVGTVVGEAESIAVFVNTSTKALVRLRVGEADVGWVLRAVDLRTIVLEKNNQTVMLALPPPNAPPTNMPPHGGIGMPPGLPISEGDL
jgi:general secretion pathway protein N